MRAAVVRVAVVRVAVKTPQAAEQLLQARPEQHGDAAKSGAECQRDRLSWTGRAMGRAATVPTPPPLSTAEQAAATWGAVDDQPPMRPERPCAAVTGVQAHPPEAVEAVEHPPAEVAEAEAEVVLLRNEMTVEAVMKRAAEAAAAAAAAVAEAVAVAAAERSGRESGELSGLQCALEDTHTHTHTITQASE
jgi:hypothetical protein